MVATRILSTFVIAALVAAKDENSWKEETQKIKAAILPPCSSCETLVSSFEEGLKRTARGKFEGGDTAWEEKNLRKGYANSELRLVEVEEKLCDGVRGETQCHENHRKWEDDIEEWWQMDAESRPKLRSWLCVNKLKICCEDGFYGAQCQPCSTKGSNGKICSGNGKCKGSGTRKGNGKCTCDEGYQGKTCDKCALGFYESYRDDEKMLCASCHKSCEGPCSGSGPKSCSACKSGYLMDTEQGCQDLDECVAGKPCNESKEFCVNTEGSHRCVKCDGACNGCSADGPDSCRECAKGYVLQTRKEGGPGVCVTEEAAGRILGISNSRYFTYLGMGVAACIISQRSLVMAGALGFVIAAYVGLSENYLQGATEELKPLG